MSRKDYQLIANAAAIQSEALSNGRRPKHMNVLARMDHAAVLLGPDLDYQAQMAEARAAVAGLMESVRTLLHNTEFSGSKGAILTSDAEELEAALAAMRRQ